MTAPVYEVTVDPRTGLGYRWHLKIEGTERSGGYAPTLWQALDNANDALYDLFHTPLGLYYKSRIGAVHG